MNNTTTSALRASDNELRAQGVDAAIAHLLKKFEGTGRIGVPVMALEWLAKELRAGKSNNAQPVVSVTDERAAFNEWNNDVDCPLAGYDAKAAAWRAWCQRAARDNVPAAAPVVPDEITPQQASRRYGGEVRGYRDGWNACRAEMLKSLSGTEAASALESDSKTGDSRCGNSPVIPDGWALVPTRATIEMVRAGAAAAKEYMEETGGNSPRVIYSAMIAAAPAQEDGQ